MTSSNPTLGAFNKVGAMGLQRGDTETMTVDGTIHKTGVLAVILMLCFGLTWSAIPMDMLASLLRSMVASSPASSSP